MKGPKITCSLPCWGRPQRTIEAIECIMAQDLEGWQAMVLGDCCPDFQKLIESGYMLEKKREALAKGNLFYFHNFPKRFGSYGYHATNTAIQFATGRYFLFFANDDLITPDHFSHYFNGIHGTDKDFMYFNDEVDGRIRTVHLANSNIGHSNLIIRTKFLQQMSKHKPEFCHDWALIEEMKNKGKHARAISNKATYKVRSYDKDQ